MKKKSFFSLFLILFLIFILRLPSLFEPYWYGDEGIYFAVTETLKRGGVLYKDVIDNKTPLIYYLFTILKTQFRVRLFALVWVWLNTLFLWSLGKRLLGKRGALITGVAFALFSSLPLLEGNIANGELFFILPTTIGFWLIDRLRGLDSNSGKKKKSLVLAGSMFGLAFLFKAPTLIDFGAAVGFLFLITKLSKDFFQRVVWLDLGLVAIIFPFVFYFLIKGCFPEFIAASFSNNLGYTLAWAGGRFGPQGLLFLKFFLAGLASFLIFLFRRKMKPADFLIYIWTVFALLGATLSHRPYLHYLIQVVPAFSLLLGKLVSEKKRLLDLVFISLVLVVSLWLFRIGPANFRYQKDYFVNFKDFVFGEKSNQEYLTFFDPITPRNYQIADFLKRNTSLTDRIFVWGDQALIYALSNRAAVGRYVAAHHINDIPGAKEETITALKQERPEHIFVDQGTTFSFPSFFQLLKRDYNKRVQFGRIIIYRRNEV